MKYNSETEQYEETNLGQEFTDEQALAPIKPAASPAITGELVKSSKYLTWGIVAAAVLLFWPQFKRSIEKITR